jgi:hypothetical protein
MVDGEPGTIVALYNIRRLIQSTQSTHSSESKETTKHITVHSKQQTAVCLPVTHNAEHSEERLISTF